MFKQFKSFADAKMKKINKEIKRLDWVMVTAVLHHLFFFQCSVAFGEPTSKTVIRLIFFLLT